jgi:hypothetical protein
MSLLQDIAGNADALSLTLNFAPAATIAKENGKS